MRSVVVHLVHLVLSTLSITLFMVSATVDTAEQQRNTTFIELHVNEVHLGVVDNASKENHNDCATKPNHHH